jgi:hypothetical protein
MARVDEFRDDGGADPTGCAGNEDAHEKTSEEVRGLRCPGATSWLTTERAAMSVAVMSIGMSATDIKW